MRSHKARASRDMLAERRLCGEKSPRQRFIDDYDGRLVFPIARLKQSALLQRNVKGGEIVRTDCAIIRQGIIIIFRWTALNVEIQRHARPTYRHERGSGGCAYSGQHRSLLEHVLVKVDPLAGIAVRVGGQRYISNQNVICGEAGSFIGQLLKTAQKQTSAHQQQYSHGNFCHYKD